MTEETSAIINGMLEEISIENISSKEELKAKLESRINTLVSQYESTREEMLKWVIEGFCISLENGGYKLRWDASAKHYEVQQEEGENNEE